jgi:tRNA pseudouridine38-40 synthase
VADKQRYFIELAYDGTAYHGWQVQQNAHSVQEALNKALAIILRQPVETTGCGRTDTGVHAKEFFAHFDLEDDGSLPIDHSETETDGHGLLTMAYGLKVRGLNSILPADISIKNIIPVHEGAHARFDATLRSYQYHIHFNKDPFLRGYSWQLRDVPDMELMNQAAAMIMDYIDFSCFSKSNTQVKTNNCKISRAEWVKTEQGMVFHISADRFLRNMVRAIVGTLMMVGKGEIPPEAVRGIIESKNRSNAGMSVPACGLYLTEVKYPYLVASS